MRSKKKVEQYQLSGQPNLLTLPAGMAIVDTGAAQDLIGLSAYKSLSKALKSRGLRPLKLARAPRAATGIGGQARPLFVALCPVSFSGKVGTLEVTVLDEEVPHLLSASFLTSLGAIIDLAQNSMKLQTLSVQVPLYEGLGGHRLVNILDMDDAVNVLLPEYVQKAYDLPADALRLKPQVKGSSRSLTCPVPENASWNSQSEMAQAPPASLLAGEGKSDARNASTCESESIGDQHAGHFLPTCTCEAVRQSTCLMGDLPRLPLQAQLSSSTQGRQEAGGRGEELQHDDSGDNPSYDTSDSLNGQCVGDNGYGYARTERGTKRRNAWGVCTAPIGALRVSATHQADESAESAAGIFTAVIPGRMECRDNGLKGLDLSSSKECSTGCVSHSDRPSESRGTDHTGLFRRGLPDGGLRCATWHVDQARKKQGQNENVGPESVLQHWANELISLLGSRELPKHFTRTNLVDNPRSVLLGAYTRRGRGVSKNTWRYLDVLHCVHSLAELRPSRDTYTSVMLNQIQEQGLTLHKDRYNDTEVTWLFACGQHRGGLLWVEEQNGRFPPPKTPTGILALRRGSGRNLCGVSSRILPTVGSPSIPWLGTLLLLSRAPGGQLPCSLPKIWVACLLNTSVSYDRPALESGG